jgi:predicted glycosyltransferase
MNILDAYCVKYTSIGKYFKLKLQSLTISITLYFRLCMEIFLGVLKRDDVKGDWRKR